jgi:hypothetical protein
VILAKYSLRERLHFRQVQLILTGFIAAAFSMSVALTSAAREGGCGPGQLARTGAAKSALDRPGERVQHCSALSALRTRGQTTVLPRDALRRSKPTHAPTPAQVVNNRPTAPIDARTSDNARPTQPLQGRLAAE